MHSTTPPLEATADMHGLPRSRPALPRGACIGRYLVLELLGQGGMGVVYKAYDPQLDRSVALKLVRAAGSAGDYRERLLREAQALARLSHPNVISVHDVGTFESDVFLAMEFVEGPTLWHWLHAARRSQREILDVFLAAGEGLAAAHGAGLVHRDFKPDNVIVGNDGRVRVLDFGVARVAREAPPPSESGASPALEHSPPSGAPVLSSKVSITKIGTTIGTPRFMAPEQHLGEVADERADQFSFCVSLYHALHGTFPFAGGDPDELRANVVLGRMLDTPASSSVPRGVRQVLARGLRGPADERYPSMAALLSALRADPSVGRRRWLAVAAGVLTVAAVAASWSWGHRAQAQVCAGAERKLAGVWDGPRRAAVRAAFDRSALPYAAPVWATVSQTLDGYAARWTAMHTDACEATQVRGEQSSELLDLRMICLSDRLMQVKALTDLLANADAPVIEHAAAAAQSLPALSGCADAMALRAPVALPTDAAARQKVEDVRRQLATARALDRAARYEEGFTIARAALEQATALRYAPVEAEGQAAIASLQIALGRVDEGKASWHRSLVAATAARDDRLAAAAATRLVYVIGVYRNQFEEADRWADFARPLIDRLGDKEEQLGKFYEERSHLRRRESRPDEGLDDAKKALELQLKVHGPNHSLVAGAYDTLGRAYYQTAQYALALECHQKALAIEERALGPDHPTVAEIRFGMANAYGDSGEHERALAEYRRVLDIYERSHSNRSSIGIILNNLGDELAMSGRPEEALAEYKRALAFYEGLGSTHDSVLLYNNIGEVLLELNHDTEAKTYFKTALELGERALGPGSALCAMSLWGLGEASRRDGELDAALAHFQRSLPLAEKAFGATHPQVARPLLGLGSVYGAKHQVATALPLLRRAVTIREAKAGDGIELAEARFALAEALWAAGEPQEARVLASAALQSFAAGGLRGRRAVPKITSWLAAHPG